MSGATPEPEERTTQLAAAWSSFTSALETMGLDALASAPTDANRVDAVRFVLRQLASPYISFTAYRPAVQDRVVDDVHDGGIDVAADGTFPLTVGGPERDSSWLDLGEDAAFVVIREYCHDRRHGVKATFEVEQLRRRPNVVDEAASELLPKGDPPSISARVTTL